MFRRKKFFGKYNLFDVTVVSVLLLVILGFLLNKIGIFKPMSNVNLGNKKVQFTVITRAYDVTSSAEIIKAGDKAFITIRNVPYTELEVSDVKKESLKEMFFNFDRPEVPYLFDNIAYPYRYQYVIKFKDNAVITKDGAVIGGNKIKIGLPIDIEGESYRFSGMVSDVHIAEEDEK